MPLVARPAVDARGPDCRPALGHRRAAREPEGRLFFFFLFLLFYFYFIFSFVCFVCVRLAGRGLGYEIWVLGSKVVELGLGPSAQGRSAQGQAVAWAFDAFPP
jgi:hypothetical protein